MAHIKTPKAVGTGRIALGVGALLGALLGSGPAQAREPSIDPRQTEKAFDAYQAQQKRRAAPALPRPQASDSGTAHDRRPLFKLTAVSISGARTFSRDALAETYRGHIGRVVSQADLADIAKNISDLYRNAGFHLTRALIPPQDINGGRIRIKVVEGSITEVVVKGDGAQAFGIAALLDPVSADRPARLATLERQLLLASDIPGIRVADTDLSEIGTASGKFRLTVYVETWRVYSTLGLDNRGTPAVGPLQGYLASAVNSLFKPGDTLAVNLSSVPDATRENGYSRIMYDMPIGLNGARVGASISYGEIWPGDETRQTKTHTDTLTFALRASAVAWRTRKSSLWLTLGASYSDVTQENLSGTLYKDHVRAVSLTGDYQLKDRFEGFNYLTVTVTHGADIMGASSQGEELLSRDDGSADFWKLNYWFTRYQKLSDAWSLSFSAVGQVASTALLSSEEFYLGGVLFGRGYNSGELSGDSGMAASLELRFDQETKLPYLKGYQLYGFVDGGRVWDFGDTAKSLMSSGGGVRFFLPELLQLGVEAAVPVSYRAPTNLDRNPRLFFSISKSFKFCPEKPLMRCTPS